MKCPVCTTELTAMSVSNITLDVCDNGCGGIWFDKHEFRKFDEKNEPDVESILKIKVSKSTANQGNEPHPCPRCLNVKMMRHFSSPKRKVTVDECPSCAGFWLDTGELTQIRNEYTSDQERTQAAEKIFNDMFGASLKSQKEKSQESLENVQRIANALKFITPSYYLKK